MLTNQDIKILQVIQTDPTFKDIHPIPKRSREFLARLVNLKLITRVGGGHVLTRLGEGAVLGWTSRDALQQSSGVSNLTHSAPKL